MPRLIVHDRAKADLDEIAEYIALDSIDAALRFYAAAQSAFNRLADLPTEPRFSASSTPPATSTASSDRPAPTTKNPTKN